LRLLTSRAAIRRGCGRGRHGRAPPFGVENAGDGELPRLIPPIAVQAITRLCWCPSQHRKRVTLLSPSLSFGLGFFLVKSCRKSGAMVKPFPRSAWQAGRHHHASTTPRRRWRGLGACHRHPLSARSKQVPQDARMSLLSRMRSERVTGRAVAYRKAQSRRRLPWFAKFLPVLGRKRPGRFPERPHPQEPAGPRPRCSPAPWRIKGGFACVEHRGRLSSTM
jgi:hypothetical protein